MSPVVGIQTTLEATLALEDIVQSLIDFQFRFGGLVTSPSTADQQRLRAGVTRLLNELRPGARVVALVNLTTFLERRVCARGELLPPQNVVLDALQVYNDALEAPLALVERAGVPA